MANLFRPGSSENGNDRLPARYPAARGATYTPLPAGVETQRQAGHTFFKLNPFSGEPLLRELTGLWKYKVRRFRLIYEVDRKARLIRIFALGHRREVYEELADRLREARRRKRVAQRNKVESQQARPARHEANDAPFADDQVLHHASELAGC